MRGLGSLIRLHKWQLEEKRRALGALQGLRADLLRQADGLEREVLREQQTAAQSAEAGWNYNSYARAVIRRRKNLVRSIADVDEQIEAATELVRAAHRELRKFETAEERAQQRAADEEARRDRIDMDEIAANQQRLLR